jgi:hypothetical protein
MHILFSLPDNSLFQSLDSTLFGGVFSQLLRGNWTTSLASVFGWLALPSALVGLYYMNRCYRIKARPFWNHWQVVTSFFGNALSLGAFIGGVVIVTTLALLDVSYSSALVIVGVVMLIIGGILYFPIGRMFTKEQAVLDEFYTVFALILAMQPLCAIAFIFDGIFKGLGKMATLRNVLLISTFVVFIPTIFILDALHLKLYAVWIAFTLWIIARGFPLIYIFRKEFIPKIRKN